MRTEFRYDFMSYVYWGMFLAMIAMTAPAFWREEEAVFGESIFKDIYLIFGMLVIVLTISLLIYVGTRFFPFYAFSRRVVLTIDDAGIYFDPTFSSTIPWAEISAYKVKSNQIGDWLMLDVPNNARFLKNDGTAGHGAIEVPIGELAAKTAEIMGVFKFYWEKSRRAK